MHKPTMSELEDEIIRTLFLASSGFAGNKKLWVIVEPATSTLQYEVEHGKSLVQVSSFDRALGLYNEIEVD